jgi:CRISPR-associated protein Cmr1
VPTRIPNFEPSIDILKPASAPLYNLDIEVVTPMFGGSAIVREVDPQNPVSGKSVRGQLRFWWRACQAPKYPTSAELFDAESKIWGSTASPSGVDIQILTLDRGIVPDRNSPYPMYALFPFQGELRRGEYITQPSKGRSGVKFKLLATVGRGAKLSRAELDEVEGALWAWILFGGVGSRTRRGCGSLWTSDPRFQCTPQAIAEAKRRFVQTGTCSYGVPIISGAKLIVATGMNLQPDKAWSKAIDRYRDFRQSPDFARNIAQQANRPGRSRWPEPDSIRDRAGQCDRMHQPSEPSRPFYPRADLGLPIIFHFQSREDPKEPSSQKDYTLEAKGDGASRMASPVIIKSLTASRQSAVPMVLFLSAPRVWDPIAGGVGFQSGPPLTREELVNTEKAVQVRPLKTSGAPTARAALAKYVLATEGWKAKEVTL